MNRNPALLMILALMLAFAGAAMAQDAPAAAENAAPAVHNKTLFETIYEGGWVMIPIGLCSILTVYLIVDGVRKTSPKRLVPPEQGEALKNFFRSADYVGAYNYCKENPSPLTRTMETAISLLGDGKEATEDGIVSQLAKENSQMQTQISYLSVIGVCTPMIGLLGTVTGMIKAFATLGSAGIGDPSSLSAAIGEVLVATASGLFIAIPAFGAFYFLRNRAAGSMHHLQDLIHNLFRKMPYESFQGIHIGESEIFAAVPNWEATPEPQHPEIGGGFHAEPAVPQ